MAKAELGIKRFRFVRRVTCAFMTLIVCFSNYLSLAAGLFLDFDAEII